MMDETTHFLFKELEESMIEHLYGVTQSSLGQYYDIQYSRRRTLSCDGKNAMFIVAIYRAYNAMGLIGYEYNGIVILNEASKEVVLDGHMHLSSGYCAPTQKQKLEVDRLIECHPNEFMEFIKNHPRSRINPNTVSQIHPVGDYDQII